MRTYWRNLRLFMFAFFVLSFGYGHVDAAARQSKSFVYDRIDVNLRLQPDGTLDVTERMTLRYSGGPFTSASREIPFQRLDAIEAIDVSKGATSYSEVANDDRTPGTFHTSRDQQKVVITWFYPQPAIMIRRLCSAIGCAALYGLAAKKMNSGGWRSSPTEACPLNTAG